MAAAIEEITGQEKCIKQFALNVIKNAKFHSSQLKANLFIAGIAIRRKKDINKFRGHVPGFF